MKRRRCASLNDAEHVVGGGHPPAPVVARVHRRNLLLRPARPVGLDESVNIDAGGLSRSRRKQERDKQHLALERGRRL